MNRDLASRNLLEANRWGEEAQRCFERDKMLMRQYNEDIAAGKWNGMMTQKHIGYTSWNDNFPEDFITTPIMIEGSLLDGGHTFQHSEGAVVMEASHFMRASAPCSDASAEGVSGNMADEQSKGQWEVIPFMGRTESGVAFMPYTVSPEGAALEYEFTLPENIDSVNVHVITKSTLAFSRPEGHRYSVSLDGGEPVIVNFNGNLNEHPDNIYSVFYPTVARRVVEKNVALPTDKKTAPDKSSAPGKDFGTHTLRIMPLDPGIVFEKIVVDFGGYRPGYLFGKESTVTRTNVQKRLR